MSEPQRVFDEPQVLELLRRACDEAGSAFAWAKSKGLPDTNIYPILAGKRRLGNQIPAALGLKRVWVIGEYQSNG